MTLCVIGAFIFYGSIHRDITSPQMWELNDCDRSKEDCEHELMNILIINSWITAWLLTVAIFLIQDLKYVKRHRKVLLLVEKIKYLNDLQIFTFDDQLLRYLPQNLGRVIKKRRNIPEPFTMTREKLMMYAEDRATIYDHLEGG